MYGMFTTFGWFLWQMYVGKYTIHYHTWMVWVMLTLNYRNIQWQKSCIICEMVFLGKKLQLWHFRIVIFKVFISQIEQFAPLKRVVSFPFGLQSVPPRTINMDTNPIRYFKENSFPNSIILRIHPNFPPPTKTEIDFPFPNPTPNQRVQCK